MVIKVLDAVGPVCIGDDEANQLRERIVAELEACRPVTIDFTGVRDLLPPFLTQAIGSLYGQFPADFLDRHLRYEGLLDVEMALLPIVRERSLWFFALTREQQEAIHAAFLNPVEQL